MPQFKFTVSDVELAAYNRAAGDAMLPLNTWARTLLTGAARVAVPQPAKAAPTGPKLDTRTAAKYATLVANLAEKGWTVREWYDQRERDRPATKADQKHNAKMLALYEAEIGQNKGE